MEKNNIPEFEKIIRNEKVVLVDPVSKVYLGVSNKIANNLDKQEVKPDEGKHNERKCYGCSHYTGMLTGSISNGRRYGTVREKYSCDYDISICPYAAGKV